MWAVNGQPFRDVGTTVSHPASTLVNSSGYVFASWFPRLSGLDKILGDRLQLSGPSLFVHLVGFCATRRRNSIEAGLHDGKHRSGRGILKLEHDEGHGLARVVQIGSHRIRMPAEGEQTPRLHPLDGGFEGHMFIALVRDLPPHGRARRERAKTLDPEPTSEFPRVSKGLPNTRPGRAKQNLFLDAIG